jgi:hypothetical protein
VKILTGSTRLENRPMKTRKLGNAIQKTLLGLGALFGCFCVRGNAKPGNLRGRLFRNVNADRSEVSVL